jgi:hypothetical protein
MMKTMRVIFLFGLAAVLASLPAQAQSGAAAGFEKLKTLAGEWEGFTNDRTPTTVSYRLMSNGSALVETITHGHETMVTVYHQDGDRLMMTHYCGAGNQPRMRAESFSADGKTITFRFLDATNLSGPEAGHMHGLVVTLVDNSRLTQEWAWHEKGQVKKEEFRLSRKK